MLGLLLRAFGVESDQIVGSAVQPRMGANFYEVMATMPPDLATQLGMALWTAQVIQTQVMNAPVPRVVDKTGLLGKYTFSLDFTPPGFMLSPDRPAADLPDLFVALREKLGLRLNKTEGVPVDVIVVDSVDKIPAAN